MKKLFEFLLVLFFGFITAMSTMFIYDFVLELADELGHVDIMCVLIAISLTFVYDMFLFIIFCFFYGAFSKEK